MLLFGLGVIFGIALVLLVERWIIGPLHFGG